jgi:hypothetical protein
MAREYAPTQFEVKRGLPRKENKELLPLKPAEIVRGVALLAYNEAIGEIYRAKDIIKHAFFTEKDSHPFSNAMKVLTDVAVPPNLKRDLVKRWQERISDHNQ